MGTFPPSGLLPPPKTERKKTVILTVRWLLSRVLCLDASVSLASECARTGDVAAPAPWSRQVRPLVRRRRFFLYF